MRWCSFRKLRRLIIVGAVSVLPRTVSGQTPASAPNAKDPALAIALGLAVPGLGHLYLGETGNALRYGAPGIALGVARGRVAIRLSLEQL